MASPPMTSPTEQALRKSPTGIRGLDLITEGGLPSGRPTLLCGNAGCGKTLLALEFLVHGATALGEPGVFMSFEESPRDLAENARSLGIDLDGLVAAKQLVIDYVHIERGEIDETGDYDLEGLFIRLGLAIDTIGAKRVVLDTIEAVFSGLSNDGILRAELRRMFRWLKDRGVTAIITGERGGETLTRHGLEEYVSDCVVLLDHRVADQVATRRLRVVKYRGSSHGTNEYPFLIDASGIEVLPVTSLQLDHPVSDERISTGVPDLDTMLEGRGYYRGSSVLISGTAGSGKTALVSHAVVAACARGERVLFFGFEESPDQILRNMRSIGLDLARPLGEGLLRFDCSRPTLRGLEAHLTAMHRRIRTFAPDLVVVDPISSLATVGSSADVRAMLLRLMDHLKSQGVTAMYTSLTIGGEESEETSAVGISSLIDTWLLVRDIEAGGERNRGLFVIKSRGMAHSNQVREFLITSNGIQLTEVYLSGEGMFTGSARVAHEAHVRQVEAQRSAARELKRRALENRRRALESQVAALRLQFEAETKELEHALALETAQEGLERQDRARLARSRRISGNGETHTGGMDSADDPRGTPS